MSDQSDPEQAGQIVEIPAGTMIYCEGDPPDYAYFVTAGDVDLFTVQNGRWTIQGKVRAPNMFGEEALIDDQPRLVTAVTAKGCTALRLTRADMAARVDALHPFVKYWVLHLTERVQDLSSRSPRPAV